MSHTTSSSPLHVHDQKATTNVKTARQQHVHEQRATRNVETARQQHVHEQRATRNVETARQQHVHEQRATRNVETARQQQIIISVEPQHKCARFMRNIPSSTLVERHKFLRPRPTARAAPACHASGTAARQTPGSPRSRAGPPRRWGWRAVTAWPERCSPVAPLVAPQPTCMCVAQHPFMVLALRCIT